MNAMQLTPKEYEQMATNYMNDDYMIVSPALAQAARNMEQLNAIRKQLEGTKKALSVALMALGHQSYCCTCGVSTRTREAIASVCEIMEG